VRITGELHSNEVPQACGEIRTSLLFAALLARMKKVKLGLPGGDVIGRRRNDTHFLASGSSERSSRRANPATACTRAAWSARTSCSMSHRSRDGERADGRGAREGATVIRNAASEPHVQQLGMALMKMGARINGVGTNTITIDGADRLHGVDHTSSAITWKWARSSARPR